MNNKSKDNNIPPDKTNLSQDSVSIDWWSKAGITKYTASEIIPEDFQNDLIDLGKKFQKNIQPSSLVRREKVIPSPYKRYDIIEVAFATRKLYDLNEILGSTDMASRISEVLEVFTQFKEISEENTDMTLPNRIKPSMVELVKKIPHAVARLEKEHTIRQAVSAWYPSQPDMIGGLFALILFDTAVYDEDDFSLSYLGVKEALPIFTQYDDLYETYYKPSLLKLLRNDDLGSEPSREFAIDRMSSKRDKDVFDILKGIYNNEFHPFNLYVELQLQELVKEFPDYFPEEKYSWFKNIDDDMSSYIIER